MFVGDVVADVVAVLEEPERGAAASVGGDALALLCWHEAVANALNDKQGTLDLFRDALQVELLQFVHRIFFAGPFQAVNVRFAAYQGSLLEALAAGIIGAAVFNGGPQSRFKRSSAHGVVPTEADAH